MPTRIGARMAAIDGNMGSSADAAGEFNATGRFAPSPSGPLHLGNLRTALVAWLLARSAGARFLLRIEDLDPGRSRRDWESAQIDDLRAIGIDWDGVPVRQSERSTLYAAALAELERQDRVYPCFCTRAEIRQATSAPHGDLPDGAYPGTCRALSSGERARRIAQGDRFALRLRADAVQIEFQDRFAGSCCGVVDDFVLRRNDGAFAYQLAVVVDDADQGVGEVTRGVDLLDSTPRQIVLQRLLGLPTPRYAHVGLVLGKGEQRLAKRDRGATLADRREPPAETLALLAHSLGLVPDRTLVDSATELLDGFNPASLDAGSVRIAS